jgi:RNA polymerase sigma-70 factor (ECF subfamily)
MTTTKTLTIDHAPLVRRAPSVDRDAALVLSLRRSEPGAVEALLAAYGDRAYRLAVSITSSASDAEEVVQDALWAVVRKVDTFRGESAFGSWIYRIVANRAYEALRRGRGRRQDCSLDEMVSILDEHGSSADDWSAQLEDPARQSDLRSVLNRALSSLPADCRALVVLRDIEGLSTQEIGRITGLSVSTVKSRTHRARLVLRKRLGEYFGEAPAAPRVSSQR